MKKQDLITLCRVAVLIALEIVLTRFLSINTPTLRIGLGFIPIALIGIMYGPYWAGTAAGIADVMGALFFSTGGAFYPPLTITAILTGISFGLFLHRKNAKFFPNIILCTLINTVVLSLGLNTYWLSILSGTPYFYLMVTRLIQCGVLIVAYLIFLPLMQNLAVKLEKI